jgi:hypothetical protein
VQGCDAELIFEHEIRGADEVLPHPQGVRVGAAGPTSADGQRSGIR